MDSALQAQPTTCAEGSEGLPSHLVLAVRGLTTSFPTPRGIVTSVDDVSFDLARGEILAVVGESGSGKSVSCLSVMRLIDPPAETRGRMLLRRRSGTVLDLARADERAMRAIRGDEIAMVFQEPMTSLNPIYTVGDQIAEAIRYHQKGGRRAARELAIGMLAQVGISDPRRRAAQYPHQHSGGMRQRAMIAMALSCRPSLLIADEATSALDVTIQAQILDLLRGVRDSERGMAMLFVTHDMGVVAELADRVLVMYAGRVVEEGAVRQVLREPRHPYTRGLLGSMPALGAGRRRLPKPIPGNVPSPLARPTGCAFAPRCADAAPGCRESVPALEQVSAGHRARCFRWREIAA